ncbi:MAG TPA: carboxypeptidase-like regulatory domain-containing protein, partial [Thermoanaerobaculia bacterium]|nr:carboxypeptidase-like regulatory domain-containing protein [Thermoanaerobaculia bacterium]
LVAGERKSGIVITIPRGLEVSGRITDRDDKPLSGVSVTAAVSEDGQRGMVRRMIMAARDGNEDDAVRSASDGTFSIRLKEGTYDLAFTREGFAMKRVRGQRVTAGAKPLDVVLEPGVEITGRVTRGGAPVEGVTIAMPSADTFASTTTGSDGSFRIGDLTPGSMMVNIAKPDEFIQEIRSLTAPARDVVIDLPRGGRVTGRVFDKGTHQPVTTFQAGVSMSRSTGGMAIMMPPLLRSFTSDDGSFTLENVPSGPLQLIVNAPGYTTARLANLTLEEGKALEGVEVALDAGTRVTGRVTDPSGTPVAGASVRLDAFNQRRGARTLEGGGEATTDDSGEYTLESMEPGEKTLVASHNSYLAAQKTVEIAGKEQRVDFQLTSGLRVTGQVMTEGGVPVGDASVRAQSASSGFHETRTDAGGMFSMENLSPGRYNFSASKQGQVTAELADYDISSGAAIRLTMKGGGTLYGRITGLTESDLANTTVNARNSESGISSASVDPTGAFRIEGAPTGTVRVSATLSRGLGERRTSSLKTVQLDPGSMQEVNLEFLGDTSVHGHVTRNGRPLTNGSVSFFPRAGTGQTSASAPIND